MAVTFDCAPMSPSRMIDRGLRVIIGSVGVVMALAILRENV